MVALIFIPSWKLRLECFSIVKMLQLVCKIPDKIKYKVSVKYNQIVYF